MTSHGSNSPSDKPARPSYRNRYRQMSHDEAHDAPDAPPSAEPTIIDHPLVAAGEPALLTTQAEVDALVDRLRTARSFAFDTEFIGEQSFLPRVCLVQIAAPLPDDSGGYDIALIDPLSGVNLTAFWALVADASIEKVVHAGQQDLEPAMRHTGAPARNIYDTQLAAAFAGMTYPMSLDNVTAALVGINPGAAAGGGAKFTQWDRRPLTAKQLCYAANDVRYLPLLRQLIGAKLVELGNTAWAAARCAELCDPALYLFDPQTQRIRVRSADWLRPVERMVLRALQLWREEAAREQDVPSRTLLPDWVMVELARSTPRSAEDVAAIRGVPRPLAQQYGRRVVALIDAARAAPVDPSLSERLPARLPNDGAADRLVEAVQTFCQARSIDPAVLTSKRDVAQFIYTQRRGAAVPDDSRIGRGWRRELLAEVIDPILAELDASSQPPQ